MATTSWYNDNQYRDYPFITRVAPLDTTTDFTPPVGESVLFDLPPSTIVDFGVVMDIDAEFDNAADYVYLQAVSLIDNVYAFTFRTTAVGAENYELVFYRNIDDPVGTRSHAQASTIVPEPLPDEPCVESTKWSGFMVTGDLTAIGQLVGDDTIVSVSVGLWQVEPARIQNLAHSYLRSVTLANEPRTHATVDADCQGSISAVDDDPIVIARCIAGEVLVKEGFNCGIRQDVNNNAIVVGAGVGIGAGPPCEEIPRYIDEVSPDGGVFLSGGPGCHEVVRSINGVSAVNLTLIAGNGLRIDPSVINPHGLVINRALDDFAQCHGLDTNSSVTIY